MWDVVSANPGRALEVMICANAGTHLITQSHLEYRIFCFESLEYRYPAELRKLSLSRLTTSPRNTTHSGSEKLFVYLGVCGGVCNSPVVFAHVA